MIQFPVNPIPETTHTEAGITWVFTGVAWDIQTNIIDRSPIDYRFLTLNQLYNTQSDQSNGYIYYVNETLTYYEYLGTINSSEVDYNVVGGLGLESQINNEVKTISISRTNLSGIGNETQQICDYINNNIIVMYSKEFSKLNFTIESDNTRFPFTFPFTLNYSANSNNSQFPYIFPLTLI